MTSLLAAALLTCGAVTSLAAPADVKCIHGNVTYTSGQLFKPDACTTCRCSRHGAVRPSCVVEDCSATAATLSRMNCRHVVTPTTECCARCDEPGCLHHGQFYAAGEVVSATRCERCWCPAGGRGHVVCTRPIIDRCPSLRRVNCVDYVTDPDTCCRTCPHGANCWLGSDILSQGDVVHAGKCRTCQCPAEDHRMTYWRRVGGRQAVCRTHRHCRLKELHQ